MAEGADGKTKGLEEETSAVANRSRSVKRSRSE